MKPLTEDDAAGLRAIREALGGPLLVHVVANGVRGDSRVLKAAQATRAAGTPTIVVGLGAGPGVEACWLEGVPVLLLPRSTELAASVTASSPDVRAHQRWWRAVGADVALRRSMRDGRHGDLAAVRQGLAALPRSLGSALRGAVRNGSDPTSGSGSGSGSGESAGTDLARPASVWPTWARQRPSLVDVTASLLAGLHELRPDALHVHDCMPLPAAVAYASTTLLRERRTVRFVYDAHEYFAALSATYDSDLYLSLAEVEAQYIRDATQVLTVSDSIADALQARYDLPRRPGVVLNAPSAVRDPSSPSLRAVLGLAEEVPLAVYSGWLSTERGVATAVRALPLLPEVHLAVVTGGVSPLLRSLLNLATELGVRERVHIAGYVVPSQVTAYLASADVGVIPHHSGEHLDHSLPTKFREYLHAGLPLVVSRNRETAREVARTGVGLSYRNRSVSGLAVQLDGVLSDLSTHRAAITDEVLAHHSWEAQIPVLADCHARLVRGMPLRVAGPVPLEAVMAGFGDDQPEPDRIGPGGPVDPARAFTAVGIGPKNADGRAHGWATAVQGRLGVTARSFGWPQPIDRIGADTSTVSGTVRELAAVVGSHTHLLVTGASRLFGDLVDADLGGEVPLIRRRGLHVAIVISADDVRDAGPPPEPPSDQDRGARFVHAELTAQWRVADSQVATRRRVVDEFEGDLFVADPGLLPLYPRARWLPLAIDPISEPAPTNDPLPTDRPLRVWWPGRPGGLDGGQGEPTLSATAGLVDLLDDDADPDVLVDVDGFGGYSAAAVRAMARGTLVVAPLRTEVLDLLPEAPPIAVADVGDGPAGVVAALRDIAARRDHYGALAANGPGYVRRLHDGAAAAQALEGFVTLPPTL